MKRHKAPGLSGLVAEMIQSTGEYLSSQFVFVNMALVFYRCMTCMSEKWASTKQQMMAAMWRTSHVVLKAPINVRADTVELMVPALEVSSPLISGVSVSRAGEAHYATHVSIDRSCFTDF